ncbi:MAG: hypothetical protein ACR2QO_03035 [Acidimicrobiales bacterium]
MVNGTDLMNVLEVEQLRRSVAMLPPRAAALDRENSLAVLSALIAVLKADDKNRWKPEP